jgi:hypothetical protein
MPEIFKNIIDFRYTRFFGYNFIRNTRYLISPDSSDSYSARIIFCKYFICFLLLF